MLNGNVPFFLPGGIDEIELQRNDLLDFPVGGLDRADQGVFGNLVGFAFDHHDGIGGAGNDHIEVAVVEVLQTGVDDDSPSIIPTRTAPTGPSNGIGRSSARGSSDDGNNAGSFS